MADDTPTDDIETWLRALWNFFDGPGPVADGAQAAPSGDAAEGTRWDNR